MRNFLFISPNYPAVNVRLAAGLSRAGFNILGVGDAGYGDFPPELKDALTDYYYVPDLHEYESVYRAVAYHISRQGRIDILESFIPYWYDLENKLRRDYRVKGRKTPKEYPISVAEKANIPVPKRRSDGGLILPKGDIIWIDGLVDKKGEILISQAYTGDFEGGSFFYSLESGVPSLLFCAEILKIYGISGGFFHLEFLLHKNKFFLLKAEDVLPCKFVAEAIKLSFGVDIYELWAGLRLGKKLSAIEGKSFGITAFAGLG